MCSQLFEPALEEVKSDSVYYLADQDRLSEFLVSRKLEGAQLVPSSEPRAYLTIEPQARKTLSQDRTHWTTPVKLDGGAGAWAWVPVINTPTSV